MKKINPEKDVCDMYRLDKRVFEKHSQIPEGCVSCFYNLFAICWFQEHEDMDLLIHQALGGYERAKQVLHKRLKIAQEV